MKEISKFLIVFLVVIETVSAQSTLYNLKVREAQFNDGDKICFIGNSITHGGTYHAFLQVFNALRFTSNKVTYINCGVAGDGVDGMFGRLEKDILVHKPTYAFIMTGMNDVNSSLYIKGEISQEIIEKRQEALDNYYLKTERLATLLIENNIQPIFLTPTIYDQTVKLERFNNYGVNDALGLCAIHIKKMAIKYNAPVVDFYAIMNKINLEEQKTDSTFTIVGDDRVHPGELGHFIMANEIIKTLSPNKYVSKMVIDAKSKSVIEEKYSIVLVKKSSKGLVFDASEQSLPFPISESLKQAAELVSFQQNLNQEILQVKNLKHKKYSLLIDDIVIGSFSKEEFETGINLANFSNTPQYIQAQKVYDLVFEYHKIQDNLRSISFVEYRMLNKYVGPDSLEGKKEYLYAENAKSVGKSWHDWNLKTINRYFVNLPKEQQLWQDLENKRDKIYEANRTHWHQFKIVKKKNRK